MKQAKLALMGGEKYIGKSFDYYQSIGKEEVEAATAVVESGVLSQFIGSWDEDFLGGPKVKEFERNCESFFGVKHAVTVNSWTSGLIAAVGAINIEPGDEIIVTPWTMCASATAIIHWNAIPVFADIDPETFNLDPASVVKNITPYTKAIMAVDIFGQSCDIDALRAIADQYNLKLILDTAQAPGALYKGKFAGTVGDVGGFSLNYHKHIHTGEGGVIVTNDDDIAERLQLIRNHAEAVVSGKGQTNLTNMVGYNFRLGEIECAIGIEQLKKLDALIKTRQRAAERLAKGLNGFRGLKTPKVQDGCTHVYYVFGMVLDVNELGVSRDKIADALTAEGVQGVCPGYANVHLLPMYQKKQAYGSTGFPWSAEFSRQDVSYSKGICPVAEELHEKTFLGLEMCVLNLTDTDVDAIVGAFEKVWDQLDYLR